MNFVKTIKIDIILWKLKIKNKEADVLIGTQMLSKGLDFDNVTLVGIINADLALNYPSYNAYEEAFNIFIKLTPSLITTLTKAERRMIALRSCIDNPMMTEEMLLQEMHKLRESINALIDVAHTILEKLDDVSEIRNDNILTTEVNAETVKAYMSSVNLLMELTDNHSFLNFDTHNKLAKDYPKLVEPYLVMSGKIAYLLFIVLISYSNHIDENLFVYK